MNVSYKLCDGGHACSPPKYCCSFDCCYGVFPQIYTLSGMFDFLIWTYWYLWAAILAGLTIAAICGCWLWRRRRAVSTEECPSSERTSSSPWYPPPHYSRCSSFVQALPPPYNEVTAKPDLYPLVIGYDENFGKGTSGFVMRYFRSLSHASTLDSLNSSFMCNVVNEANTIVPPPYSCENSIDELSTSAIECERPETVDIASVGSFANPRTTSDISSLAAQSPSSPPRATSPTVELRELLGKIQQLPQLPNGHTTTTAMTTTTANLVACKQKRPQVLTTSGSILRPPLSPVTDGGIGSYRVKRARGKMYMPLGLSNSRNKTKRWLSRSAPTTPSGAIPMSFLPGRPSETDGNNHQAVPLLSEQDETENNTVSLLSPSLTEQEEEQPHQS